MAMTCTWTFDPSIHSIKYAIYIATIYALSSAPSKASLCPKRTRCTLITTITVEKTAINTFFHLNFFFKKVTREFKKRT